MVTLKYGKKLDKIFRQPGGPAIKHWLNTCDNNVYCALTYMGGKGVCRRQGRTRSWRLETPLANGLSLQRLIPARLARCSFSRPELKGSS